MLIFKICRMKSVKISTKIDKKNIHDFSSSRYSKAIIYQSIIFEIDLICDIYRIQSKIKSIIVKNLLKLQLDRLDWSINSKTVEI